MNRTILITGGAGNIGSALAHKLALDKSNRIVIFDNLITGSRHKIPSSDSVIFEQGDTNLFIELADVFLKYQFDYVFHYAALVGVERTLKNPLSVLSDIEGIKNILDLSVKHKIKRVFYSSSSEVYGEPFEIPQNEKTTPLNSSLPYAVVKNLGEVYFKTYKKEFNLDYTIFRFFNTYGLNQSTDFVVPRFVNKAIKGESIEIYGDGAQTRTFCWVEDNVDTCINCLYCDLGINDIINVGSGKEISIKNLAQLVIKLASSSSDIKFIDALEEGDMTRRCPDTSKMRLILKRDLLTLEDGLKKMIEHYAQRS